MKHALLSRTAQINLGGPGSGPRPGAANSENAGNFKEHLAAMGYHNEAAGDVPVGNMQAHNAHLEAASLHEKAAYMSGWAKRVPGKGIDMNDSNSRKFSAASLAANRASRMANRQSQ